MSTQINEFISLFIWKMHSQQRSRTWNSCSTHIYREHRVSTLHIFHFQTTQIWNDPNAFTKFHTFLKLMLICDFYQISYKQFHHSILLNVSLMVKFGWANAIMYMNSFIKPHFLYFIWVTLMETWNSFQIKFADCRSLIQKIL